MDARLQDRFAIQDLLVRYCRGVDRRDWAQVRDCFHPDARDDHGEYKGDAAGFMQWVQKRHAAVAQSMHFIGNCLIEFAGEDVAVVETYYVAWQQLDAEAGAAARSLLEQGGAGAVQGALEIDVMGRYVDRFERRGGAWRIARRAVVFEALRTRAATGGPLNPAWAQQKRDRTDPLYAMRREAGLPD
jgi:hypothetical protein